MLIPNVTKLPNQKKVDSTNRLEKKGELSEFKNLLQSEQVGKPIHGGLDISSHAVKRLKERQIDFDGSEYLKIKQAMTKLKAKGSKDSLVITDKAAYIVDVKNEKIVTAVDKNNMSENVFTKIDSTLFMN
jgi:flagellar operon protein